MNRPVIGVIGGSGLYEIDILENQKWVEIDTPWGPPSDEILTGEINSIEFKFLPRHGRGHVHSPTSVPYRSNIDALKQLGVTDIISISACGSFREEMEPGDFVIVDQFIDRTVNREKSFFGPGCVAHVSMAYPVCQRLASICQKASKSIGVKTHPKGTYLAMEGPQFSTLSESRLYRDIWNCDVIGMTNMPEAKLAREAEICYATIAMVTDYDCWHPNHGEIDIEKLLGVLKRNTQMASELILKIPELVGVERLPCPFGCDRVLDYSILTPPEMRSREATDRLANIISRVQPSSSN
ncbi:MAG: S-methyl-5'-thioadenosine phosphorylase [Paracoccaceae bacterium]|nr:S-methyl-5'-thioadenosine phosphorylase [Paracoccaceae bacterium]MDE2917224.1 S-methyl-5'-thioadenosine phosphorylase [Paracoccaceae bacterium]